MTNNVTELIAMLRALRALPDGWSGEVLSDSLCTIKRLKGHDPEDLRQWANAQVGKTQRLHALRLVDELPRSAIGKVLKRELRDGWVG